jgi:hypothetical protein
MSEVENEDYKEKDIVWANVKGYSWWPSLISKVSIKQITTLGKTTKEKMYTIELLGEKFNTKVSSEKIEPFMKNIDKHTNNKNTSLVKSIDIAKRLIEKKNKKEKEKDDEPNKKDKDIQNNTNDNNPKFLQKKRMKDRVILDEEQNEEEKDIKIKPSGVENIDLLSATGGGVKINININLTNNNQRTYNLNSFQSPEVINPATSSNTNNFIIKSNTKPNIPKFSSINYSNISANEKTGNKNSNKKDKNLNVINNNNKMQTKDDEEKSIKSLKKEKKSEEKDYDLKLGEKPTNKNKTEESNEENENSECDEENEELILTNDIINESIQKILNCQIQISNISSQKTITKELNNLSEMFNEYFSKNQDEDDNAEIYYLSKDLRPILLNLTYNKNPDIVSKSSEIISILNGKIVIEVFNLSKKDQKDLIESFTNSKLNDNDKDTSKENNNNNNTINLEEEMFKEEKDILDLINKKSTIKSGISDIHTLNSKRGRPKKNSTNSELSSEVFSSRINEGALNFNNGMNEKNYYEEFIKLLSNKDKTKVESDFKDLSDDFFENIYDKNNNGLDIDIAKIRKSVCIKILKVLKKARPDIAIELLKKMIVYFEYKIRFSNTEKIYSCKIKDLFEYLKEKLSDNDKVK